MKSSPVSRASDADKASSDPNISSTVIFDLNMLVMVHCAANSCVCQGLCAIFAQITNENLQMMCVLQILTPRGPYNAQQHRFSK